MSDCSDPASAAAIVSAAEAVASGRSTAGVSAADARLRRIVELTRPPEPRQLRTPRTVHQLCATGPATPGHARAMASVEAFCRRRGYTYRRWGRDQLGWLKPLTYRSTAMLHTCPSEGTRAAVQCYNILFNEGGCVLVNDFYVDERGRDDAALDALLTARMYSGGVLLSPRLLTAPAQADFLRAVLDALPWSVRGLSCDDAYRRVGWPYLEGAARLYGTSADGWADEGAPGDGAVEFLRAVPDAPSLTLWPPSSAA